MRRTGCTRATHVADRWRLDRRCVASDLGVRACQAAGRACVPVSGGRLDRLTGVRCPRGRSEIELVLRRMCRPLDFSHGVTAITTGCSTARRVARLWRARSGCGRDRCQIRRWTCRRVRPTQTYRCLQRRDPRHAFEIDRRILIEGG